MKYMLLINEILVASKLNKVAIMIPYRDGLSILDNLEGEGEHLRMYITKGVST